jgi:hypothetical protein
MNLEIIVFDELKEIQLLKAELSRKDELIAMVKARVVSWEHVLKQLCQGMDVHFKARLDSCTNVLTPADHINNNPQSVMSQHPANQSFDQPSSLDNSVIVIDNKNY